LARGEIALADLEELEEIGFVLCSKCGARIRADREWCLRCHEPLVAYQKPELPLPSWVERLGGGTLIFGALASVAIVVVAVTLFRSNTAVDDTAHPSNVPARVAPAAAPAAAAAAPAAVPAARIDPVKFLDAERRGTADFGNSDFAAARAKFEEALKAKPGDPELINNLGLTLERLGQIDAAIDRFAQAVSIDPKSWAYHFNLAHAAAAHQEWDRSIAEYRAARDIFPDDYATQYNLALTLHRKGDDVAAIPEFEKAISLAPSEPTFHLSLAASLEKAGRVADAKKEYQQYLDMAPGAVDADQVRAHLQGLS
jgi:Flp pilus assembly protein TadD